MSQRIDDYAEISAGISAIWMDTVSAPHSEPQPVPFGYFPPLGSARRPLSSSAVARGSIARDEGWCIRLNRYFRSDDPPHHRALQVRHSFTIIAVWATCHYCTPPRRFSMVSAHGQYTMRNNPSGQNKLKCSNPDGDVGTEPHPSGDHGDAETFCSHGMTPRSSGQGRKFILRKEIA